MHSNPEQVLQIDILDSVPTDGSIPLNINLQLALFIIAPSIIGLELFKNNTRGLFCHGESAFKRKECVCVWGGALYATVSPEKYVLRLVAAATEVGYMAGRLGLVGAAVGQLVLSCSPPTLSLTHFPPSHCQRESESDQRCRQGRDVTAIVRKA